MKDKPYIVYIISSTSGHYKIGHTSNIRRRLEELRRTAGPFVYELECQFGCGGRQHALAFERLLHNRFSDKRVNGEWFTLFACDLIEVGELGLYRYDAENNTFINPVDELILADMKQRGFVT